jgi:hypothetical protein
MNHKSELMYRMDALRAAGLTGDMMALADTLAPGPDGKPTLITSSSWLAIYNDNLTVRLAYDRDKYGEAYDREHGVEREVEGSATITPRKLTAVPITPIQGNRMLQPSKPEQDTTEEHRPMATHILTATARNVAQFYRNPPVGEPKPEDAYIAWLLETLATALEKEGQGRADYIESLNDRTNLENDDAGEHEKK